VRKVGDSRAEALLLAVELADLNGGAECSVGNVEAGEPLPFDLDLDGARELALEVDMATRFHEADRANWLGMLLVR
jgi:hypothetical protein